MSDRNLKAMSSQSHGRNAAPQGEGDTIDLLHIVALFSEEWRLALVVTLLVSLAGFAIIQSLPKEYQASTVILPKEPPGGSSSLGAFFGAPRQSSTPVDLLISRTLKDDVIRRSGLMLYFKTQSKEAARRELTSRTVIAPGIDTITVQIRDRSAVVAAQIANAYIDALRAMQERMATTQSELQRTFFERQVQQEREALARAEADLEQTQEGSGIVQLDTQTQLGLRAIADARAQITVLQVQLAALLQQDTEENADVKSLRSQIAQLSVQERSLEAGTAPSGAGSAAPAGRMPSLNLENQRKLREVRFHEALVSALTTHFDDLRMSAQTPGDSFAIIDPAVVPEFPGWPPRRAFRELAAGCGLLAGVFAVALRLALRRLFRSNARRARMQEIRAHFGPRARRA